MIDYFKLVTDVARAQAAKVLAEQRHEETWFICKGCGIRTQNHGDFPYHSSLCKWTPTAQERAQ
jgi:hypothetical protein